jgi:hypothetical protein
MKRTYLKLLKNYTSGNLTQNSIQRSRDCDALIASLIGWDDIELDNNKEWIGDAPQGLMYFNCLGRCIIPRFTGEHGQQLFEFMLDTLIPKDADLNYQYEAETGIHTLELVIGKIIHNAKAKSFSEVIARLLVEIKTNVQ